MPIRLLARLLLRGGEEQGSSLIEIALVMPVLLLLLAGAIDFGRAYYLAVEVASAAHAGAIYGSQNWGDTADIKKAAQAAAPEVANLTFPADPVSGCECPDGTGQTTNCGGSGPSCSPNVVNYVTVSVTASYTPILPYPGIPTTITLQSQSTMRAPH